MSTKGSWHRPESKQGAFAEGWERIFGAKWPEKIIVNGIEMSRDDFKSVANKCGITDEKQMVEMLKEFNEWKQ